MTTNIDTAQKVKIAYLLSVALYREIGLSNLVDACRANHAEVSDMICHTHDYCDANAVLLEVLENVGYIIDLEHDGIAIINDVHGIAKKLDFFNEMIESEFE